MTARIAMTYQDYAGLPDDGKRHEIHDGALSVTPAPSPLHQIVSGNLFAALRSHVRARQSGLVLYAPVDVILSDRPGETTILQPDIVFVDSERLSTISRRAIEGAPTLAVEILSASTALTDRTRKRQLYARYGVPYYWLVDLDAQDIEANVLRSGEYRLAARVSGTTPVDLSPFTDLALVPASLWQ